MSETGNILCAKTALCGETDDVLVERSLAGEREAFGRIVERYERMISSIAYCGLGNLSRSEEIAQETFLVAWRQLGQLREAGKIRGWLCQIARNLVSDERRKRRRIAGHISSD